MVAYTMTMTVVDSIAKIISPNFALKVTKTLEYFIITALHNLYCSVAVFGHPKPGHS